MSAPLDWVRTAFVVLLGLEFGSFANVCIYRWPKSLSVNFPRRSYCPWCEHQIEWRDNIPVISFLLLRARCRNCRSPISIRYPLVEVSVAALWLTAYLILRPAPSALGLLGLVGPLAFLFVAVITTMTDIDWRVIPDEANLLLAVAGLVSSAANPHLGGTAGTRILGAILGMLAGAGTIWLIGAIGSRVLGRDAMGGGDVKLLGAMGTVIGWDGALFTLFLAAFIGGIVSLLGMLKGRLRRREYIPFGPFLNIAGVMLLFYLCSQRDLLSLLVWTQP